ncbi:VOC family protein [Lentiprolixibacter aurantiacus]|uniref:VOC family protein n=1 Tax=Lentiprolixibacter aurantiacus TaxID=2993939 RepID=A0AAE3MIG7_9FLAO|nr:VOC family protein [Lentiprolixibacter aurantiacus]MCX2718033.1 VOC family protein [Lentiprolixibacter aurantiacus]
MAKKEGKFRFAYFTDKYQETCGFYRDTLELKLEHSWDRSEDDKGSLFKAGMGLIEVLKRPGNEQQKVKDLDYRHPQGAFMVVQVWEIDELFKKYKKKRVPFKEEIKDQAWGHRSFAVLDPNGVVLFFIEDQFDV